MNFLFAENLDKFILLIEPQHTGEHHRLDRQFKPSIPTGPRMPTELRAFREARALRSGALKGPIAITVINSVRASQPLYRAPGPVHRAVPVVQLERHNDGSILNQPKVNKEYSTDNYGKSSRLLLKPLFNLQRSLRQSESIPRLSAWDARRSAIWPRTAQTPKHRKTCDRDSGSNWNSPHCSSTATNLCRENLEVKRAFCTLKLTPFCPPNRRNESVSYCTNWLRVVFMGGLQGWFM